MLQNPERVFRSLAAIDLPPPVEVQPLGRSPFKRTLGLRFPEGARLERAVLQVIHADLGFGGVGAERAALRHAHLLSDLPVPREYAVLDPGLDGPAISLASWMPGEPGTTLLSRGGPAAEEATRQVGRVLSALEGVFHSAFASRATAEGELLPRRARWREEIGALLEGWVGQIAAGGTGLGLVSARLAELAQEDLGALDTAHTWGLIHGDLQLGNLLLAPDDGALLGVVGWDRAMAGDPLYDWAISLSLPSPTLARVVEGYGRDRASELLDPDALARLGVYWRARCLQRLAVLGHPALGENEGRPRALALEMARARAQEAMAPEAPRLRLEEALRGSTSPVLGWARPSRVDLLTRRALEVARVGAALGGVASVAAGLACAENGELLGDAVEATPHLMLGERILPRVSAGATPLPVAPIPDRGRWMDALVARAFAELAAGKEPGPSLSLAFLALARRAIRRLDGAVSDATLRGIEALFFGSLALERLARARPATPAERILHGWIGAWALAELRPPDQGGAEGLRSRLAQQTRAGWEALAVQASDAAEPGLELLRRWPSRPERGADPLLPITVLALVSGVAPPGLDAPPSAVLAALRLAGAET